MGKKRKSLHPNDPLFHTDHPRPVSRRDFIRQGFMTGTGVVAGSSIFSLFANPRKAFAELSGDISSMASVAGCPVGGGLRPRLPVICFDLAGGANIAGSNVLTGGQEGQRDFLSTAGYSKLGIPDTMLPTGAGDNIEEQLGLLFHAQSQMGAGIIEKAGAALPNVNGVVIPARSDNDTANNPHNPMYAIARAFQLSGRDGNVVPLVGSRNSESGGNSTFPPSFMNPELRPTKVDRPTDVTGMIDTGDLTAILNEEDVKAVMESIARLSHQKLDKVSTGIPITGAPIERADVIKDLVRCGYFSAADIAERFANEIVDPAADPQIVGPGGIFSDGENGDWNGQDRGEFRKTASVMKMVLNGYAGAGTITMGGFDYHTGDRAVGERRDLRAGRCIGACLNYAQRLGQPLMIYVFSDGSVSSNGRIDDTPANGNIPGGGGKGEWTSDNSSTAASFILLYDPNAAGRPTIITPTNQLGWFSRDASVVRSSSPAADNVNALVNTVLLNYMSASGMISGSSLTAFENIFTTLNISHGLGSNIDKLMAFGEIITPPV